MSSSGQSSTFTFLISLIATALFAYCVYYLNFDEKFQQIHKLQPPGLRPYGHYKFLTIQCLHIQLVSSILHVCAHFVRSLERPRDLVFNSLAYPIGSIVCYSFWSVWFLMGRELIFPREMDGFYPTWLNHATHTIIIPLNLLLALLVHHKHRSSHTIVCLAYFTLYTVLLHYIKFKAGVFVYKYLETMNDLERIIYFAGTGLFAYLLCKSGQFLGQLSHQEATQRPALKKTKQK